MKPRPIERLAFLVLVTAAFGWAAWEARSFPVRARVFPQTVASTAFLLGVFEVVRTSILWRRTRRTQPAVPEGAGAPLASHLRAGLPYLLWIVGFYVAIALLGFLVASGAFVFLFLVVYGRVRWYTAFAAVVPVLALLLVLSVAMNVVWPSGQAEEWLGRVIPGLGEW